VQHVVALAGIEGRIPPEIASKAETDGVAKAKQDPFTLIALGVLGGAFIAFGAIFSNVALAGSQDMAFGIARVVSGFVFGVGLSLVLLGGAQIFTGDVLMVMAWASGRLSTLHVLRLRRDAGIPGRPSPVRRWSRGPQCAADRHRKVGPSVRAGALARHTLQCAGLPCDMDLAFKSYSSTSGLADHAAGRGLRGGGI
jgi:hypothetical protein